MLHYRGSLLALELGREGKQYIWLYAKKGEDTCKVPFMDLDAKRKRYVLYRHMADQWVFVDLVDE